MSWGMARVERMDSLESFPLHWAAEMILALLASLGILPESSDPGEKGLIGFKGILRIFCHLRCPVKKFMTNDAGVCIVLCPIVDGTVRVGTAVRMVLVLQGPVADITNHLS